MTSYHAATVSLLDETPRHSEAAAAEVSAAERRLGFGLPRSVREWYSYENALSILAEHSNQDHPIAVRDFAVVEWQSRRLLPFRDENQYVCTWAIELDGSDDPPVWVDVDSGGKVWGPATSRFSSFVYSCVWDYRKVFSRPAIVQAQNRALSPEAVSALSANFSKELQTQGWPGRTQYRFDGDDAAILIWSAQEQADWFIAATSEAALKRAVVAAWLLDDVGAALYECSPMGDAVLHELREQAF